MCRTCVLSILCVEVQKRSAKFVHMPRIRRLLGCGDGRSLIADPLVSTKLPRLVVACKNKARVQHLWLLELHFCVLVFVNLALESDIMSEHRNHSLYVRAFCTRRSILPLYTLKSFIILTDEGVSTKWKRLNKSTDKYIQRRSNRYWAMPSSDLDCACYAHQGAY